jgi:hypothetical protein
MRTPEPRPTTPSTKRQGDSDGRDFRVRADAGQCSVRSGPTCPPEIAIKPPKRRRIDPRLLAPIAMLIAAVAIGLEIAYTIGHYFNAAAQQIH